MTMPKRGPLDQKSSSEASMDVKKKLVRKKSSIILACNESKIKKEYHDSFENSTIRKWEKSSAPTQYGRVPISSSAMDRAKEVQAKLPSELPSCTKLMLRSHVTAGFWLSLPKAFTDSCLPNHDATVVLVDENDKEYQTKYLVEKNGLSAGWRGFSISHKLVRGDVLVFQLIKPCRIKVYIVRANGLSATDGAISLLNLEHEIKPFNNVLTTVVERENQDTEHVNALLNQPSNVSASYAQSEGESALEPAENHQFGNQTEGFGFEMLDGIRFSESIINFKDIKDFESFSILVDGLVIDSEIPKDLRTKYYDLCCSQNSILHEHLVKGLNCKLAAGIISETVNIADAIRTSKLNTSCDYLQTWDKTLKAFEDLGMTVGFLRDRIKKLVCLQHKEQEIINSKTLERAQVQMHIKNLEAELLIVKGVKENLDAEIEALKVKNEMLVTTLREMASAPW